MSNRMKFNDQLTVGPQPSQDELKSLPDDGFRSVINFRTAGEDEQPLSPEEEGEAVRATGLKYLHVPVSMDGMDEKKVDQFREQYQSLPKPVLLTARAANGLGR